MTMKQAITAAKFKRLTFTSLAVETGSDGMEFLVLKLKQPIPIVKGSQLVYNTDVNETVFNTSENVTEIRITTQLALKGGFRVYKNCITYQGQFVLDVATRYKTVWLTDKSFRSIGQRMSVLRNDRMAFALLKGL